MEQRYVITYRDSMGVLTESRFETFDMAMQMAIVLGGDYVGMCVWPSSTTIKN